MLLFIIHGASRTAEGYLEDFLPHIQEKNLIAVAPKFSKESYPHYAFLNRSAIDGKNFLLARQILITLWEIFLR